MNKIYHFILLCFAALCFTACNDDDSEISGIEGTDHYISDFSLTVGGITYQAAITGDKISVEIPYNTGLEGATVEYTLSEGASINPNPSTIQDWGNEWKFIVTSKMQESKVYFYTYRYADIEQSGNVLLATQAEVDNFAQTGINKIDGNLTIGTADGEEITNLEGLANLKHISHALIINPSYKGTDLSGLDNLEELGSFKLGSTTSVSKNTTLKAVILPSLLEVIGDFVINSTVVETIALPNVESIGENMYIASDALLDLTANAVSSIGSSLFLKGSTVQKGTAESEAIVFPSLKQVGADLSCQYFPKLQGIYMTALENVSGSVTFDNLSAVGSIALTELHSTGDLKIKSCGNLTDVELPKLVSCGAFYISGGLNKLNIFSLKSVNGEMYLGATNLEELDVSAVDINGYALSLYSNNRLRKIIGPETFNGSIYMNQSSITEFSIEGISDIQGYFDCYGYNKMESFIMPFSNIAGYVKIRSYYGRSNLKTIEFSNLREIGGELILEQNYDVEEIGFPVLKRIAGAAKINSNDTGDILFNELERIGSNDDPDATTEFTLYTGDIVCPKLKMISGSLSISAEAAMTNDGISYPNLETISNKLKIYTNTTNKKTTGLDFPNLKSVKQIEITRLQTVTDFTTFGHLFENGVLTEESQWSVSRCGYNPTYQDMKEGRYKPAE